MISVLPRSTATHLSSDRHDLCTWLTCSELKSVVSPNLLPYTMAMIGQAADSQLRDNKNFVSPHNLRHLVGFGATSGLVPTRQSFVLTRCPHQHRAGEPITM